MKERKALVFVALGLLLIVTMSFAANSLDVNANAAVEGNFGLELNFDGSNNLFYVMDQTPERETSYRASFWIEEGTLNITNCGTYCSTQFMFLAAQDGVSGKTVFRIVVGRMVADDATGERHLYRFSVKNDNGDFLYVGGLILNGSVTRKHVTIEWQQGSPGIADGVARLYTSNDGGTPNLQGTRTYMNNTYAVDQVIIGGVAGLGDTASDASTNGTLHFDSFESYRTLLQ